MTSQLVQLLIIVGALIVIWVLTENFSPHPALTMIVKVILFIAFIVVVLTKLLPFMGVHI